jgi:tellurite resistance protein TehA-like permease
MTGIDPDSVHPGYFLPTAAGGLIGANAAAQVHLHALAEASFGIGVICWVMLGSTILNRLFIRPALPSALVPTMAIELGIPAVAGLACCRCRRGPARTAPHAAGRRSGFGRGPGPGTAWPIPSAPWRDHRA